MGPSKIGVSQLIGEVVVDANIAYFHTPPPPPNTYPSLDTSILPHTYPSLDTFIPPHIYTSLPSLVSRELASMAIDITLSFHPLSSPTLPPTNETMVDLVSELGAHPTRRPCAPRIRRALHPLAPSAPSALFEIARDHINQLAVYSRCRLERNIKTPSCGTQ